MYRTILLVLALMAAVPPAPARAQPALTPRLYLPAIILGQADVPLPNGDFERGPVTWLPPQAVAAAVLTSPPAPVTPRSGIYAAWLLAEDAAANSAIDSPAVLVPRDRPALTFWTWIQSDEPVCGVDLAGVNVLVGDQTAAADQFALCGPTQSDGWRQRTIDLRAYVGQTVTIELFVTTFNAMHTSSMYVDDVAFQAAP